MKRIIVLGLGVLTLGSVTSCRDSDLEPTLAQSLDINSIKNEAGLKAFLGGIYSKMRNVQYLGRNMEIYGEVRTDNAYANGASGRFTEISNFLYGKTSADPADTWEVIYQTIGRANFIINKGVDDISGDKITLKHYLGEAYAIRAMAHFDLLRLFGQQYVEGTSSPAMNAMGIPYVKIYKGDPSNENPVRNTVQEVYDYAKADFEKAAELMDESRDDSSKNYMTKSAVYGLLARMELYFQKYENAKIAAKKVIDSGKYSVIGEDDYVDSWKTKSASNVIFSIYTNADSEGLSPNSLADIYRVDDGGAGYGDVSALGNLYDIFDKNDIRISSSMVTKKTGKGSGQFTNLGKYPTLPASDDIVILRYEEVLLTYAEALARTGDNNTALIYINEIVKNRGISTYTSVTVEDILKERRKELAFEGFRFDDLVRTGQGIPLVDELRQAKNSFPILAGDYRLAFAIPNTEMAVNQNMKQNKGYK